MFGWFLSFLLWYLGGKRQIESTLAGENYKVAPRTALWGFLMETSVCAESHAEAFLCVCMVTQLTLPVGENHTVGEAPVADFPPQ